MAFTDEDLCVMKDECVAELEALGFELNEITDIHFTKKGARTYLAMCLYDRKAVYDWSRSEYTVRAQRIIIHGKLRYLDDADRWKLKTLVMHEVLHCVINPHETHPRIMGTPHCPYYDEIKQIVEQAYGYTNIDSRDGCNGLSEFVDQFG